jgi:hypothetical protein
MIFSRAQICVLLAALWTLAVALPNPALTPRARRLSEQHAGLQSAQEVDKKGPVQGTEGAEDEVPPRIFRTVLVLSALCLGGLLVWKISSRRRRQENDIYQEYPRRAWPAYVFLLLLLSGLSGIFWVSWRLSNRSEPTTLSQGTATSSEDARAVLPPARPLPPPEGHEATTPAWVRYLWLTLMMLFAAGIWHTLRRNLMGLPSEVDEPSPGIETSPSLVLKRQEPADPVIRCYRDMCHILKHKAAMTAALTAREFAQLLADVGIHDPEVANLTDIFEHVRYGGQGSGPKEHAEAAALLHAIESRYERAFNEV